MTNTTRKTYTDQMIKKQINALLFDMDGVLINSVAAWWHALNEALIHNKYPPITKDEFTKRYWGHDLHDTLALMKVNPKVLDHCNALYETYLDEVVLFPDAKDVLTYFQSYPKSIITNTPRFLTEKIIRHLSLESFFDAVVTGDDVGKGKPYPDIIYKACNILKVESSNTVLIGDTKSDITAGHAAQCTIIGVNIKADYTISSLAHLKKLIPKKQSSF